MHDWNVVFFIPFPLLHFIFLISSVHLSLSLLLHLILLSLSLSHSLPPCYSPLLRLFNIWHMNDFVLPVYDLCCLFRILKRNDKCSTFLTRKRLFPHGLYTQAGSVQRTMLLRSELHNFSCSFAVKKTKTLTGSIALIPSYYTAYTWLDWHTSSKSISRGRFHCLRSSAIDETRNQVVIITDYRTDHNWLAASMMRVYRGTL